MVIKVDIGGIQNAEMYVNRRLAEEVNFRRYALSKTKTTLVGNEILFYFEPMQYLYEGSKVLVKQFSKEKYASCDKGIRKFAENGIKKDYGFRWQELLVIEQEKYWLVIFEKI